MGAELACAPGAVGGSATLGNGGGLTRLSLTPLLSASQLPSLCVPSLPGIHGFPISSQFLRSGPPRRFLASYLLVSGRMEIGDYVQEGMALEEGECGAVGTPRPSTKVLGAWGDN